MTVPSPALMDAMCGAVGAAGTTERTREIGLAAANAASPLCVASMVQDPMARMFTSPAAERLHTEPPAVMSTSTARPLELETSGTNPGCPSSIATGWAKVIAWLSLPTSMICTAAVASNQFEFPGCVAVISHTPEVRKVMVFASMAHAAFAPFVISILTCNSEVATAVGV